MRALIASRRARLWLWLASVAAVLIVADLIAFSHFSEYQIEEYGPGGKRHQEHYPAFQGPVFLFLGHWVARGWHFLETSHHELLSAFTIGIFIVTALLALYTYGLWSETKTLREGADTVASQQRRDMRRSIAISRISALAAKKAAKVAESALLSVERPYLFVNALDFNPGAHTTTMSADLYEPVVTYSVFNHGKLPAIIDMVNAEVIHAPDERLDPPLGVDLDDPLLIDRVLGANDCRQGLKFEGTLDADVVKSPNTTDHEIFFWIVIQYHGPFTKGHETSGCWRVAFGNEMKLLQYGHDRYNYTK